MASELVQTHKKVALYRKKFEASITIDISGEKGMRRFWTERSFGFDSGPRNRARDDDDDSGDASEWRLIVTISGEKMGVAVERRVKTVVKVSSYHLRVTLPTHKIRKECTIGFLPSGEGNICALDDFFDIPEDDFEIAFSVSYSLPVIDEDVIYCTHPDVEQLSSKISAAYEDLFNAGNDSDVCFVVDGEEVPAHKAILTARVPYFAKMMSSGMVEAQSNRVDFEDADAESFKRVLKYIYCGKLPEDLETSAGKLLPLADRLDLPELRRGCLFWMERSLSQDNVCDTLIVADLYRCTELKKKCLSRLNRWKASMREEVFEVLVAYPRLLLELALAKST